MYWTTKWATTLWPNLGAIQRLGASRNCPGAENGATEILCKNSKFLWWKLFLATKTQRASGSPRAACKGVPAGALFVLVREMARAQFEADVAGCRLKLFSVTLYRTTCLYCSYESISEGICSVGGVDRGRLTPYYPSKCSESRAESVPLVRIS